jgi:hypothetical protein
MVIVLSDKQVWMCLATDEVHSATVVCALSVVLGSFF